MPEKRQSQSSKQRRAARNRAQREALAARRSAASERPADRPSAAAAATSGAGGAAGTAAGTGRGRRGRRPGDVAVMAALVFAVAAFLALLVLPVPTDDRGEALPATFGGVALEARSQLTGQDVDDITSDGSVIGTYGPGIVAMLAIPALVAAVVFVLNRRRPDRSRVLTIGMLVMAGIVFLSQQLGMLFLPALIALGVAGFQVRRAELPARTAGGGAAARPSRDRAERDDDEDEDVIDVDEIEPADEPSRPATGDATGDEGAAPKGDAGDQGEQHDDVLAELEAELAREHEAGDADADASEAEERDGRRRR